MKSIFHHMWSSYINQISTSSYSPNGSILNRFFVLLYILRGVLFSIYRTLPDWFYTSLCWHILLDPLFLPLCVWSWTFYFFLLYILRWGTFSIHPISSNWFYPIVLSIFIINIFRNQIGLFLFRTFIFLISFLRGQYIHIKPGNQNFLEKIKTCYPSQKFKIKSNWGIRSSYPKQMF